MEGMDVLIAHNREGGGSSETRGKGSDVFLSFCGQDDCYPFVSLLSLGLRRAGICVFWNQEEPTEKELPLPFNQMEPKRIRQSFTQRMERERIRPVPLPLPLPLTQMEIKETPEEKRLVPLPLTLEMNQLLERDRIRQSVTEPIRYSKIAVPILSQNYPSSPWCLRELAQMVECQKTSGQIIMPVFLDFTPSADVYGKAISKHRRRGVQPNTLREWEEALIHVGSIPESESDGSRPYDSIIDALTANVLRVLKRNFIGIEHHVERVMKLLNVEFSDVRVVGIHGIGGTGKTTIAKFIYKRILHLFDGCSFLESVRENAKQPGGLVNLQGKLISDLLGAMRRQIPSVDDGIKSIRSRFFHKKVLIVLDDIEPSFELTAILGSLDWLGSGSRIIITTRAEQALDKFEVFLKYKVGGMQPDEALKLFHFHAFREKPAPHDFATLSEKIVSTIDRLPLTVEVVGSYLFSKSKDVWKQTLDELEKVPELQVEQNLMVIIKALPDKQRQIFLDIACFFIGEDKSVACYLWSDHDSASGLELEVLILSSIVKIENNKIWMHDQLRDLGRNILQQEETGKRSRLWIHEEALDVLMKEKGTESVEGVLLKFDSRSQCSFRPAHFASTSNIRFLRLDQANLEGNFERHMSSLRWLHWQGCPRNLCAENLDLKRLVILDLSWSKVNEKWNGWREIEKAEKLKVLNLTGCNDLIRTPDLSYYKCLERLILERCIRLVEIDSSVKSLESLVSLNLRFCAELNKLPEELGSLISLQEILIDGTAVQEIPASIGHMQNLRRFSACNCLSLIQLPESISHVKSLRVLALNGTKITKLPMSGELEVLQHLSINHCWSILKLPTSLGTLASLVELDLSSTGIVELPNTVNELYLLRVLKIDFTFVRELPCAIWTLKRLEELHASRCRSLDGEIPRDIAELSELRVLRLGYTQIRGLPDNICRLPKLQTLDLLHCDKLCKVPKLPSTLISLSVSSKLMDTIPDISSLVRLGELFLADGSQGLVLPDQGQIEVKGPTYLHLGSLLELKIFQLSVLKIQLLPVGLGYLSKLKKLSLCCIHFEELPQLPSCLFTLSLRHYKSWTGLPDLSYLKFLSEFELLDCAVIEIPGLGKFESLRVFRIFHCNLQQLDELENLIFLVSLNVSYCQSLDRLPDLSKLKMLKDIKIKGCPKIPNIKSVEHLNSFEKPSSSIIEAESLSEVGFSKPANTGHSSIQGVISKDNAVSLTDMTTSAKDDGNAFPVNDKDEDECNIPEGEKNKPAKSIALAISDKQSFPPKVQAKSSESDKSITETMGASSNLQNCPSVGGSSNMWCRAKAVASKFNFQLIFRTKPTHSFAYKSDLCKRLCWFGSEKSDLRDVEPDKDPNLSVDLTGTKTTGISPTTEEGDMRFDRASTIPSSATIVSALPPAARPKPSSAKDEDKTPIDAAADLYGDDEESLFSKIESLLRGNSGKQNTGAEMSRSSQSDLQAYVNASQEVENIMSQGLLAIMSNRKLLGHLQELLNFLVEHKTPEVSTIGHVYLKLQNLIQSVGDSLSSQQKILIECERFKRELKKEKNFLASDKDEVLLLKKQVKEKAKSVADNEQVIAKLQAEIGARKLQVENAKSELSSLLIKKSEKVKELKNGYEQVLHMESENPSMEKKRNQAQETIDKINVEWNELYADMKGRSASK